MKPRFDMFSLIHKAQRYAMCETMMQVSALDTHSPFDTRYVVAQVSDMLDYCEQCVAHVATHIVPLMEACVPGSGERVALGCDERRRAIAGMRAAQDEAANLPEGMSHEALASLQARLNAHVARALVALDVLGRQVNRVLWPALPDFALAALEESMLAGFAPATLRSGMQWMMPALSRGERIRVLAILRRRVGPEFATSILAMSKDLLRQEEYGGLRADTAAGH